MVSNNFYLYSGHKSRDYVLVAGHSSPTEDQYEYTVAILSYAKQLGVKELVSFGARCTETVVPPLETPKLTGLASDKEGSTRLEASGITISRNESAFYFGNIIVPICRFYGLRGYKVSVDHGEPVPNPKSVMSFLGVLSRVFELSVDASDLEVQARELEDTLRRNAIEGVDETNGEQRGSQGDDIYR